MANSKGGWMFMVVGVMFKGRKVNLDIKIQSTCFLWVFVPGDLTRNWNLKPSSSYSSALSKHLRLFTNQSAPILHINSNVLLDFLNSSDCFPFVCAVVSTLLTFVRTFERAHAENIKQMELEKKRAQTEAEKEKAKLAAHKRGESQKPGISDQQWRI